MPREGGASSSHRMSPACHGVASSIRGYWIARLRDDDRRLWLTGLLRRDDWHQQIGVLVAAGIDGVVTDIVVGVVVRIGGTANAVAWLDVEADAMTFLEHHRRRPDLHL